MRRGKLVSGSRRLLEVFEAAEDVATSDQRHGKVRPGSSAADEKVELETDGPWRRCG